ncbi:HalOD1 output domain-containing protein [Halobium palmae]|uniref:HalOD1 output domain-containing protein n=1 Tax=Halobium palmae TaxID=1776492 RepID=A0ABD5S1B6_9EURY
MTIPFRTIRDIQYDERRGEYHAAYDDEEAREVLVDIVLAVADILGVEAQSLEPVHRSVDTDVFERCLDSYGNGEDRSSGPFSFRVDDCLVTVTTDEIRFERRGE